MLFKNILFLTYLALANSQPISFYNFKVRTYRHLNSMTGGEDLGSRHLNSMTGGEDLGSRHLNSMTGGEDLGSRHNNLRHNNLRYLNNFIE